MKNLLFAAATATMVIAVSPSFASIADESHWGLSRYPSAGECRFQKEVATTQHGRVTRLVYVCS